MPTPPPSPWTPPGMPPPIVDVAWWRANTPDAVVCEVGSTMGRADPLVAFEHARVPGARFVSLEDDLSGPPAPGRGRHPLPEPGAFAATLGGLGIGVDTVVIAVDRQGGALAARLVWMLRALDRPAALLDGGMAAWDGPTETGPASASAGRSVPVVAWPSTALADADAVAAHLAAGGVVIDSRDPARYAGEVEPIDAVAGHVPGAVNLPFTDNLDGARFRPTDELRSRFAPVLGRAEATADADPSAIVYCGSGVTACHNALAIEHAGFAPPRVYVGSWSGWSSEPGRPIARGAAP